MGEHAPLRVLQVLNHMDYGGIESVVMNYYRHIDRSEVQFDFAVSAKSSLPQKEEIEKLGGRVYILPVISHLGKYLGTLQKIIREHHYGIVHCHMNTLSVFPLFAAYLAGAKIRICHNHTTAHLGEGARALAKYLTRPFGKWFATDYFACGKHAGIWMYGKTHFNAGRVLVLRNAIDLERFRFNFAVRALIRKKLDLDGKFVLGHIGRFTYTKNHTFLLDIFYEVYQQNKNTVLLLVGEGDLEAQIRIKASKMGLEQSVIFYGVSSDTSQLYQVMDVFCLPSFYEGVPVVAVEAQGSGLPTVVSDRVTSEVKILDDFESISLNKSAKIWADKICCKFRENEKRYYAYLDVKNAGYSILEESEILQKYYMKEFLK